MTQIKIEHNFWWWYYWSSSDDSLTHSPSTSYSFCSSHHAPNRTLFVLRWSEHQMDMNYEKWSMRTESKRRKKNQKKRGQGNQHKWQMIETSEVSSGEAVGGDVHHDHHSHNHLKEERGGERERCPLFPSYPRLTYFRSLIEKSTDIFRLIWTHRNIILILFMWRTDITSTSSTSLFVPRWFPSSSWTPLVFLFYHPAHPPFCPYIMRTRHDDYGSDDGRADSERAKKE